MATTQEFGTVSRRVLPGMRVGGAGLLASGCSHFDYGSGGGEDGGTSITIASTSTIDALDPHYVNSSMYILRAGLMEGLLMQWEDGTDVVPALAESWDESEDGLTYTFHLREAKWSNGEPVTSEDALFSFQRLLSPSGAGSGYTTGASSSLPSIRIKGAAVFQSGATDNWAEVGIFAPDESTVEVTLASPNPDFLINMTHYSMSVLNKVVVEADSTGWTAVDSWVGNGHYALSNWDPTTLVELEKNPVCWDADNVGIDRIALQLGGDMPTNILAFNAGELDITGVGVGALAGDPTLVEKMIEVPGYACHYLQTMWGGHEAFRDQRVRGSYGRARLAPGARGGLPHGSALARAQLLPARGGPDPLGPGPGRHRAHAVRHRFHPHRFRLALGAFHAAALSPTAEQLIMRENPHALFDLGEA